MSKYGTKFTESEIILAAQAEDYDELNRLVENLLPNEKRELENACDRVKDALYPTTGLGPRV